ncbi:MAG TPA: glycosyltransferase family 1 protein [Porphyromonadaceae bacterium]|nr:glycosyltransferase family 1 protein [Porphyromonadaceae bacterium]
MKIGFDAKRAVQNYTGLGNYSRYIVEILAQLYPENNYILYAPRKKRNEQLNHLLETYKQIKTVYPVQFIWRKLSSLWRVWGMSSQLKDDGIQVFHGLSNELPLTIKKAGVKSVVTIHDLIFLRFPQYYKPIDRKIYTYKFRKACENADQIIAISACTKRDIIDFFGIAEDKIKVVYQGCDDTFRKEASPEKKAEVRTTYHLPERYILNVGSIEERKNVLLVAQAVDRLPQDTHLVIVGKRTAYTQEVEAFIREHHLQERIHIYSNVPFNDLPAIYQQAEAFVYPSRYEGFGIPIIEALHSNVPVVGATGSCLEEAGGPSCMYVHPDSVDEMAEALNDILSNTAKRQEMIAHGKAFVKQFSKEKQAAELMNIYRQFVD